MSARADAAREALESFLAHPTRPLLENALSAVLDVAPIGVLPKPSKIEDRAGDTSIAWFGGTGYHPGSGTRDGKPEPLVHRNIGISHAIEGEAVYRLAITDRRDWRCAR